MKTSENQGKRTFSRGMRISRKSTDSIENIHEGEIAARRLSFFQKARGGECSFIEKCRRAESMFNICCVKAYSPA